MRETKTARIERMHKEYDILCRMIPQPQCALHFTSPLQLLIATVLSAQTTDKRVNTVTPELFATYPTAHDLAEASPAQIEDIIHPLGFYRSKTQHLIGLATALDERFDGQVPQSMDELTSLPGVGRKTANGAGQRFRHSRLSRGHSRDARDRSSALAIGLALHSSGSRENRAGDYRMLPT